MERAATEFLARASAAYPNRTYAELEAAYKQMLERAREYLRKELK